ncbi:MAG TPA: hypothetical protein VGK53_17960 [Propionicimonas sp.]
MKATLSSRSPTASKATGSPVAGGAVADQTNRVVATFAGIRPGLIKTIYIQEQLLEKQQEEDK